MAPKELLDLRFDTLLTPVLLPRIYRALVALIAVLGLAAIVVAAVGVWWLGLIALLVVPPLVVLAIAITRVGCEMLWHLHEVHDDVRQVGVRFAHLEGVVDELAAGIPKLGFLRRGPTRERPAAAETPG